MRRVAGHYGSVVFDCDSTLSALEGIDELAGPHRAEVERLTNAAMLGEIPLEAVYGRRLELIRPTRAQVDALGRQYIDAVVPDARDVVTALRSAGVAIRVMSGGLRPAVAALAAHVGVPDEDVAAVDVYFADDGSYTGFDVASPLARAGGKRQLLESWRRQLPGPIMFVGDGATDLEAAPAADLFVAFAGIVDRPAVTTAADVVVRAHSLSPIVALALGDRDATDSHVRTLLSRGRTLLKLPISLTSASRDHTPR